MKLIIGITLILGGLIFGLYIGLWWAFIGGIVAILEQLHHAPQLDALKIAFGIARVIFAVPIGQIAAVSMILPGMVLLKGA